MTESKLYDSFTYRIRVIPSTVTIDNPPPLEHEDADFRLRVKDEKLIIDLKGPPLPRRQATDKVEAFLSAWNIFVSIGFDYPVYEFNLERGRVANSTAPQPATATGQGHIIVQLPTVKIEGTFTPPMRTELPPPPERFVASPDVTTMWFRYSQHIEGKEPLTGMAYFCLTVLESTANNNREDTATIYRIDLPVLDTLGELVSAYGHGAEQRKRGSEATGVRISDLQQKWIRQAVKAVIRRKGEYDYDPSSADSLPLITMANLLSMPHVETRRERRAAKKADKATRPK